MQILKKAKKLSFISKSYLIMIYLLDDDGCRAKIKNSG